MDCLNNPFFMEPITVLGVMSCIAGRLRIDRGASSVDLRDDDRHYLVAWDGRGNRCEFCIYRNEDPPRVVIMYTNRRRSMARFHDHMEELRGCFATPPSFTDLSKLREYMERFSYLLSRA